MSAMETLKSTELAVGDLFIAGMLLCESGKYFLAENIWTFGALLMLHNADSRSNGHLFTLDEVASYLEKSGLIIENRYSGEIDGDNHLVAIPIGSGTVGTAWKIFGKRSSVKVATGRRAAYFDNEAYDRRPSGMPVSTNLRIEYDKLEELRKGGIRVIGIHSPLRAPYYVREFIEGVIYLDIASVLPPDEYREARSKLVEFSKTLKQARIPDIVVNNIVWDRHSREWLVIDG
jgi:hypothetical protein